MTQQEVTRLTSPDLNLSAHARVLILHVGDRDKGDGVELSYPAVGRLLGIRDLKVLRRVVGEAEASGYVVVRKQTGQGRHPFFSYRVPENAPLIDEDRGAENGTLSDRGTENTPLSADRGTENVPLSGASATTTTDTTPPTPPTAGVQVRAPVGLDDPMLPRLRAALGDHADAVEVFAVSADHRPNWPTILWSFYRPPGTEGEHDGGGTHVQHLVGLNGRGGAVIAAAMLDWASKQNGRPMESSYFRRYVERAAKDERAAAVVDGGSGAGAADGHAGTPAGGGRATARGPGRILTSE